MQNFVDTEASDVAFLHSFCSRIISVEDVESILQMTLDSVAQLVGCDSCFLSLRVDANGAEATQYRIEAVHSQRNLKGITFSDQDGLAGCVIRGRESILLANRKRELGSYVFTSSVSVGGVTSFLGVPLLTKDDVPGVICLIDSGEDFFNQRDLRVISILANSASLAIANAKTRRRSRELSTTVDGLTGLHNFSGFRKDLEAAFQEASQRRRPLSLVIIDIDNFREINDISGYEIGNQVLKKIARILLDISREYNISVARYGPDEFALIFSGAGKEQADFVVQMIRKEIENPIFIAPNYAIRVSIDFGISSFPQDSRYCSDLVNNALRVLSTGRTRDDGKVTSYDNRNTRIHT